MTPAIPSGVIEAVVAGRRGDPSAVPGPLFPPAPASPPPAAPGA